MRVHSLSFIEWTKAIAVGVLTAILLSAMEFIRGAEAHRQRHFG